jgi:hypothetical protein
MDTVTLAITLPMSGTAHDYAEAISMAITQNAGNGIAQFALGHLLACIQLPKPMVYTEGKTDLVYGKI